jgi:hypothetical protein
MSGKLERFASDLLRKAENLEVPAHLEAEYGEYAADPTGFVRKVLGVNLEPYQVEILDACLGTPRIAWRAAHGVGKTALLAWVLLWWLLTRPFSRVLILAPAYERQVGRYLLPEVKKWVRRAPKPMPVVVRANSVEIRGHERDWFAVGVQASDPDLIEGAHAESLAVLCDEGKGLNADVVAALHGTQTDVRGDRLYFLASVPGGPSGPFYDVFRRAGRLWKLFHTAAHESKLVSPGWIEERAEEWGTGSPLYAARVLGDFPEEDQGVLYRLSDLEAAVGRELQVTDETRIALGVDCARFGADASALAVWHGKRLEDVQTRRGLDTMEVAAWIASEINRREPARVMVDEIGIGSGVVDRLKQLGHHCVEGVNVGSAATRPDLYANRRAEVFWRFREALEKGEVALPNDERLLAELSAMRFEYSASGKIKIEEKAETRKRVGRSPDRCDAAVLGFSGTAAPTQWIYTAAALGLIDDDELESERLMRRWKLNLQVEN